jgi:hypothetical protein
MNQQQLICSLIKDDLTNSRLINGLNHMGLDAGDYFLHLSETIFQLMGFENNHHTDEVYTHYLELTGKAHSINLLSSGTTLDQLAQEIYLKLSILKNQSGNEKSLRPISQ